MLRPYDEADISVLGLSAEANLALGIHLSYGSDEVLRTMEPALTALSNGQAFLVCPWSANTCGAAVQPYPYALGARHRDEIDRWLA